MKRFVGLLIACATLFLSIQVDAQSVAQVEAGTVSTSFIILDDGSLWAFGYNPFGQLGDGTSINRARPVWIMDDVVQVASNGEHTMAIRNDGSLWAWGRNLYLPIGEDMFISRDSSKNAYLPVKIMDDVIDISVGWFYSAAVMRDGSLLLWEWGAHLDPVKVLEDVSYVSAGNFYIIAIKNDGSLWWHSSIGSMQGIQLRRFLRNSPEKIFENVEMISAGGAHMVLWNDGDLISWGNNHFGQIGDGTISEVSAYKRTFQYAITEIMSNVVYVSAGEYNSMAIKEDGTLWAWGRSDFGVLGDVSSHIITPVRITEYMTLSAIPNPIKLMDDVISVSVGENHALAIRGDGSLWVWGANWFGQLGDERLGFDGVLPTHLPVDALISANQPIRIALNNNLLPLDTPPIITNDRTLVPMRAIFESLGMEVTWNADTQTAIGEKPDLRVELSIGSDSAYINGEHVSLDAPAVIENGRTMVPVRFIAEASGADVSWDASMRIVRITDK